MESQALPSDFLPLSPSHPGIFSPKRFILSLLILLSLFVGSIVLFGYYPKGSQADCIATAEAAGLPFTSTPPSPMPLYWPVRSQERFEKYHTNECANRDIRFDSLAETLGKLAYVRYPHCLLFSFLCIRNSASSRSSSESCRMQGTQIFRYDHEMVQNYSYNIHSMFRQTPRKIIDQ